MTVAVLSSRYRLSRNSMLRRISCFIGIKRLGPTVAFFVFKVFGRHDDPACQRPNCCARTQLYGFLRSRIWTMRFEEMRAEKRKDPLLLRRARRVWKGEMHLDSLRTSAQVFSFSGTCRWIQPPKWLPDSLVPDCPTSVTFQP
jgi:hypothetical protein